MSNFPVQNIHASSSKVLDNVLGTMHFSESGAGCMAYALFATTYTYGNAYAQYLLGKLTLMGEGVPKDMDAAYEWFAAARDNGHAYAEFFMKRMERGEQEPPSVLLASTRLLYHMGNIFRDNALAPAANGVQIDRKRLAQLRQKRVALGHKPDDHEPEQQQGYSMQMHM